MMTHQNYSDELLRNILTSTKSIAVVGASANVARPSHGVMNFLLKRGYRVTPVNPGLAGQILLGQEVFASVSDITSPADMIDVFRNSDTLPALADEILKLPQLPKVIWMQLGVVHLDCATLLERHGITVIMNRCPAIEIPRLGL
jgi:uncharacterized protein